MSRKDQDLIVFSEEHLAYELEMFFCSAAELICPIEKHPSSVRNALLESFTLHGRCLLFFFYPENPRSDDALAEHFLQKSVNWKDLRPPITDELKKLGARVGKEIAHLTYSRMGISEEQKLWNFGILIKDLLEVFRAFVEIADKNKLSPICLGVANQWIEVFLARGILLRRDALNRKSRFSEVVDFLVLHIL